MMSTAALAGRGVGGVEIVETGAAVEGAEGEGADDEGPLEGAGEEDDEDEAGAEVELVTTGTAVDCAGAAFPATLGLLAESASGFGCGSANDTCGAVAIEPTIGPYFALPLNEARFGAAVVFGSLRGWDCCPFRGCGAGTIASRVVLALFAATDAALLRGAGRSRVSAAIWGRRGALFCERSSPGTLSGFGSDSATPPRTVVFRAFSAGAGLAATGALAVETMVAVVVFGLEAAATNGPLAGGAGDCAVLDTGADTSFVDCAAGAATVDGLLSDGAACAANRVETDRVPVSALPP